MKLNRLFEDFGLQNHPMFNDIPRGNPFEHGPELNTTPEEYKKDLLNNIINKIEKAYHIVKSQNKESHIVKIDEDSNDINYTINITIDNSNNIYFEEDHHIDESTNTYVYNFTITTKTVEQRKNDIKNQIEKALESIFPLQ